MKILRSEQKTIDVVDKVICNKCGMEIKKDGDYFYDHISIYKKWGFFSGIDNETHEFDLCLACYKEIIKSFKIKPGVD